MTKKIYEVAVIGGGAAGTMAVQRTLLNNNECLFFPGASQHRKKSRAFWVTKVENMPSLFKYKKGIEDPNKETLEWLLNSEFKSKLFYQKNKGVVSIRKIENDIFELTDNEQQIYFARFVILCTGVMDVQPKINGQISPVFPFANAQLADYCLRCDGHHVINKKLGIIGHTSSALWVAIMLYERYQCPEVSIFCNGEATNFDTETLELSKKYNFKFYSEKISEYISGKDSASHELKLEAIKLENKQEIKTEILFIALGMIVYNELALALKASIDTRGFVITDAKGKSSVDGLYIAGDLRANTKKQIYTAWDTAVDSADEINALLRKLARNQIKK